MKVSDYAKKLILQDLIDLKDIIFSINKEDMAVFMLGSLPYVCLIVNEGYDWCKKSKIDLPLIKSKETLENIRAKAKLFSNDKYLNFDAQLDKIKKQVKIEHTYFKSLASPFAPDFFIDDTGTYLIDRIFIGNTIQYAIDYSSFSKKDVSIYESRKEIYDFSVEIGTTIGYMIKELNDGIDTYENRIINSSIKKHRNLDYKFKKHIKNKDNFITFCLSCRINFLLTFFKEMCRKNSMLYLRFIYITFYSLKNDLEKLNIDTGNIFEEIYDRKFRNTMAHYSLYDKISESEIKNDNIGYGIIEKYFMMDYQDLVAKIEDKLLNINDILYQKFKLNVNKGYDPDK